MNTQTVRHMVIFDLKHPEHSPEAVKFLEDGRSILSAIPTVTNFVACKQVSIKNEYTYGFTMDFADQAAYDAYNEHPAHAAFVEERWKKEVERFLEIDFQIVG